jgi:hypothetical protein
VFPSEWLVVCICFSDSDDSSEPFIATTMAPGSNDFSKPKYPQTFMIVLRSTTIRCLSFSRRRYQTASASNVQLQRMRQRFLSIQILAALAWLFGVLFVEKFVGSYIYWSVA